MKDQIEAVKRAKATNLFAQDIKTYGSKTAALRALDCQSTEEAIQMLSAVQTVSVFKYEGKIIIQ